MTTIASCRMCGAEPQSNARFCGSCGSPLEDADQPAEYKQVTVLFADVVHSMDIAATVGAERLREIMSVVFQRSSAVVNRYGGTVSQFTGDGLMAVFGAPVALEDHAFRACLAALDIQKEAQLLGATVGRLDGIELRLRVGLNSGEVIAGEIGVGPSSYTTIGEQVGMAQRMESVAPPGGVMLSESTARLVETIATLDDREMVRIKGSDTPVVARRLIGAGSATRPLTRQLSTLVGRDWELETVAGMLQQSVKGKGRIVGLVGPPGIGKSRLAAEISSLAAGDAVEVFTASCESHTSDLPFHVATRLLRETLAIGTLGEQAARASIRTRMESADPEDLVLLEDLLGIRDEQTTLPAIDADARGRRLSAMLNAAVVARKTPAVYVIEDVHWIDEVSEAMIAEFAAVVPQTCALLLLTYRPEYRGALDRLPSSHRVALATLDASESATLVSELLGADESVTELGAHVAARAAGNPLFAEEIIRDLAERGVIEGAAGTYVCRREPVDLGVPASLQAAIAARVDRLSPRAKRTLHAAAVVGTRFDTDLLNALVGEIELQELVNAELIDQVTFTGRGEYAFRHPLIRAVAYESQLKADRARLHRDLAAAIRDHAPEDPGADAALVAQHLEAAGDLRDAFDWHMRAGGWAQHRDVRAARTSWQRARDVADLLPSDGPGETALRIAPRALLCANTWRFAGGLEDTGFDELRELCLQSGDSLSLSAGMAGVMTVELFHNRYTDAARVASDCIKLLESIGEPNLTLVLWGAVANVKVQAGQARESLRLAQHIIDLADGPVTKDDWIVSSPLAFGYGLRGVSRLSLGIGGWREDLAHALRLGRTADTTTLLAMTLYKYAIPMHNGAVMPDATGISETAETHEIAERSGDGFALDCAYMTRGTMLVNTDGPDRALGLELLAAYRDSSLRKQYTARSVRITDTENAREKFRVGDLDGAIELARDAVDFLYGTGEMTTRGPAVTVLVDSLLRRGADTDIAEASNAIDRLAAVPTDPGYVLLDLPLLRMHALLGRARGDEAVYRDFADKYRAMANDLGFEGHIAIAASM